MQTAATRFPWRFLAIFAALFASVASAQLAQEPLLNRSTNVPPNVTLIVDDSSSMNGAGIFEYGNMSDSGQSGPGWATAQGHQNQSLLNGLAYDPRIRYRARLDANGNPMAPTAQDTHTNAYFPRTMGPYVANDPLMSTDAGYFVPSYTPAASEVVPGSTAIWPNLVSITESYPPSMARLFPKWVGRTDCTTLATACTAAEERANYRMYRSFYETRAKSLITNLGFAMWDVPDDSIRLAYGGLAKAGWWNSPELARGMSLYTGGPTGTKAAFMNWLNTMPISGATPLRTALYNVGRYHERRDSDGPWATNPNPASVSMLPNVTATGPGAAEPTTAHASCRRSYALFATDGRWNDQFGGLSLPNVDDTRFDIQSASGDLYTYMPGPPYRDNTANTMADVAMSVWGRDLRPDLPNRVKPIVQGATANPSTWQNVSFYSIVMGLKGTLPQNTTTLAELRSGVRQWPNPFNAPASASPEIIDDIWHATVNGRGEFINVYNSNDLGQAFKRMLRSFSGSPQTTSGVAVSTADLRAGTRKYRPEYVGGIWTGNITAIELDPATGNDRQPQQVHWRVESGGLDATEPVSTIPDPAQRTVLTWSGTSGVPFTPASTGLASDLVDYLKGDTSKELRKTGGTLRDRVAKLGDIVNSSPILVREGTDLGYDRLGPTFAGYRGYLDAKRARPQGVLMVGANDGMLHGFRESDGREVLAFVPKNVVNQMYRLSDVPYTHRYFVDGPLTETDAYFGGAWRNVVLGTAGAGGRSVFALRVGTSSADNFNPSNVLWEVEGLPNLGHVLSEVQAGVTAGNQWVAIFGNGYASQSGQAVLFVVNLETGAVMRQISVPSSSTNGLGGVTLVRDEQGRIQGAFAGDLLGRVWKFNLSGTDTATWNVDLGGNPLYTVDSGNPITATPVVVPHPQTGRVVVFGSGKFFEQADLATPYRTERLYGVWDSAAFGSATGGGASGLGPLTEQTITTVQVQGRNYFRISTHDIAWSTSVRGWYITLPHGGERLVYPLQRLPGTFVLAATLSPESSAPADVCTASGSGSGWIYILDGATGSGTEKRSLDTNNDGVINALDALVSGVEDPLDGRPSVISISSTSSKDRLCLASSQANCTQVELACGQKGAKACPTGLPGVKSREWRQLFLR